MKGITLFILLSLSLFSFADCASSGITVYPQENDINHNTKIFLEGYYFSQETIRGLGETHEAWLVAGSEKVKLIVEERYEGMMYLTMAVMRPETSLKVGIRYTLKIEGLDDEIEHEPTRYNPKSKKWEAISWMVSPITDETAPVISKEPVYQSGDYTAFGCGPAISASFKTEVTDHSPLFALVELEEWTGGTVNTYLVPIGESGIISVGHGMCSGAFTYEPAGKYKVRFKVMDVSGNVSGDWSDWINFKNPAEDRL